jgi:Arc/MetJ-type ribon-helix-helix transcriptional regulator
VATRSRRTTIALPSDLLDDIDQLVGEGKVRSRNQLIAQAIRRELAARKRAAIDASFQGMADDEDHRKESETLDREFATAGWEAFRQAEAQGGGLHACPTEVAPPARSLAKGHRGAGPRNRGLRRPDGRI